MDTKKKLMTAAMALALTAGTAHAGGEGSRPGQGLNFGVFDEQPAVQQTIPVTGQQAQGQQTQQVKDKIFYMNSGKPTTECADNDVACINNYAANTLGTDNYIVTVNGVEQTGSGLNLTRGQSDDIRFFPATNVTKVGARNTKRQVAAAPPTRPITNLEGKILLKLPRNNEFQDEIVDEVRFVTDANGVKTGEIQIIYNGNEQDSETMNNIDFRDMLLRGFDTTTYVSNLWKGNHNYNGVVYASFDFVNNIDGAKEVIEYLAESQEVNPLSTIDLGFAVNQVAFYKWLANDIQAHIDENGVFSYTEDDLRILEAKFDMFGNKKGMLGKTMHWVSPIGFLSYFLEGYSYDATQNRLSEYELNIEPSIGKFRDEFNRTGEISQSTMLQRYEASADTFNTKLNGWKNKSDLEKKLGGNRQ